MAIFLSDGVDSSIVYRKFLEKMFTVLKGHGFSRAEKIALIKGL